jgi:hypothetical protein
MDQLKNVNQDSPALESPSIAKHAWQARTHLAWDPYLASSALPASLVQSTVPPRACRVRMDFSNQHREMTNAFQWNKEKLSQRVAAHR